MVLASPQALSTDELRVNVPRTGKSSQRRCKIFKLSWLKSLSNHIEVKTVLTIFRLS